MRYTFQDYTLDPDRRELRRAGEIVSLEPQVFDLLVHLIRNRDRVVSQDEMMSTVWEGRTVSDATLRSRLNAARTAIGDSGQQQDLIRTLPRKGIRFVGTVREEAEPAPPVQVTGTPSLSLRRPSRSPTPPPPKPWQPRRPRRNVRPLGSSIRQSR